MFNKKARGVFLALSLWLPTHASAQPCQPAWDPDFDLVSPNSDVRALLSIEAGSATGLYAAGLFTAIGSSPLAYIARYDGSTWAPMDQGFNRKVFSLILFQGAIYAGGNFTFAGAVVANRVAQWTGALWQPLADGLDADILTLAAFDDGTGASLYAGGVFTASGAATVPGVARWTGVDWTALDTGLQGGAKAAVAMLAYDDGAGSALYVGGSFLGAGGQPSPNIVTWTGSAWTAAGAGLNNIVRALAVFNGQLIAGGDFTNSGSAPVAHLAKWTGSAWTAFSTGANGPVHSLAVVSSAAGDLLVVGGAFTHIGSIDANNVALFDSSAWAPLATGANSIVNTSARFQDRLYVGATAATPSNMPAIPLRRWLLCDTANPEDLNGDGVVNGADLAALLIQWGAPGGPSDFNADGVVNGADLALLLINWG